MLGRFDGPVAVAEALEVDDVAVPVADTDDDEAEGTNGFLPPRLYSERRLPSPQFSDVLPGHGFVHSVSGALTLPAPSELPQ